MILDHAREGLLKLTGFRELSDESVSKAISILNSAFESLVRDYLDSIKIADSHLKIPSCGYVFQRGDIIYRCKTCTHDETCVLCADCFQESDHYQHDVTFSISKGSGGSCDCGEDESWKTHLSCPAHGHLDGQSLNPLCNNEMIMEKTAKIFAEVLAFIVPILSLDTFSVAKDHANLESSSSNLQPNSALVLYNDESHSYDDVIGILTLSSVAQGRDLYNAEYFAKTIDAHGFAVLASGEFVKLEMIAKFIRTIKLDIECWPCEFADEYILCYYTLLWLETIVEDHVSLRTLLINVLIDSDLLRMILSRDHFLLKGTRKVLNGLLIKCGLFDPSIKHRLGIIFGDHFFGLLHQQLSGAREPEHSLVHFTVQLFTVPSIISELVKTRQFFVKLNRFSRDFLSQSSADLRIVKKDFSLKLFNLLSCYRYIFNDPDLMSSGLIHTVESFEDFIVSVVKPFERLNSQIRAEGEHVLFESNAWIHCFNIYTQISDLCFVYIRSYKNVSHLQELIRSMGGLISVDPNSVGFSFHHPCVMILSYLIRRLYVVIPDRDEFHHHLMNCVDFSNLDDIFSVVLEPLIFCSEISADLWVRNGRSMYAQSSFFLTSPYRTAFVDAHYCVLKSIWIVLGFSSWIEKFRLHWPMDSEKLLSGSARTLLSLVYGVSLGWPENGKLISEALVAVLRLGARSYSDLVQCLPECFQEYSDFRNIVDDVCMHSPRVDPFDDLKLTLRQNPDTNFVCPFYWIYTIEMMENAKLLNKEIDLRSLNIHFKKASPLSFDEFALLGPISSIDMKSLLTQILRDNNGLTIELCNAISIVALDNPLGRILDRNDIVSLTNLQSFVDLQESLSQVRSNEMKLKAQEAKRRALISLQRKQSIVNSLTRTHISEEFSPSENRTCRKMLLEGTCVFCQEDANGIDRPFGLFAHLRESPFFISKEPSWFFTGCSHLIHMECYQKLPKNQRSCPLCCESFNLYLPVLSESQKEAVIESENGLRTKHDLGTRTFEFLTSGCFDQLYQSTSVVQLEKIQEQNIMFGYELLKKIISPKFQATGHTLRKLILDQVHYLIEVYPKSIITSDQKIFLNLVSSFLSSCIFINREPSDPLEQFHESDLLLIPFLNKWDQLFSSSNLIAFFLTYLLAMVVRSLRSDTGLVFESVFDSVLNRCKMTFLTIIRDLSSNSYNFESVIIPINFKTWFLSHAELNSFLADYKLNLIISKLADKVSFQELAVHKLFLSQLPDRYDHLLRNILKKTCINCHSVPHTPALCLLCGTLLCARSECCVYSGHGECTEHIKKCGRVGGILLLPYEGVTLFLSPQNRFQVGFVTAGPYADRNGQSDVGLRKEAFLYLDTGRVSKIMDIWYSGSLESYIRRKSEHNTDFHQWSQF